MAKGIAHMLVPEHKKLSEKDKKALFLEMDITFHDLPKIRKTDAGIAHLEAKEGDVIQIVRNSQTAGECIFYRGVV